MNKLEKFRHNKDRLALFLFLFSLVCALALAFYQGETIRGVYFEVEIVLLIVGFLLLKYAFKKEAVIAYFIILVAYIFSIATIFLYMSTFYLTIIFFYLLVLSTLYLVRPVFITGFILGGIGLFFNGFLAGPESIILKENLGLTLLTYILAGVLSG